MKLVKMVFTAILVSNGFIANVYSDNIIHEERLPAIKDTGPKFLKEPYQPGSGGHVAFARAGACGGGVKDKSGEWLCCSLDQRPECDTEGNCACQFDQYCYDICNKDGNCGNTPSC